MNESKKKYYVNGKVLNVILKNQFLYDLIQSFLNKNDSSEFNIAVAVNDVLIRKEEMEKEKNFYDDKIEIVTPFLEVNHSMELMTF